MRLLNVTLSAASSKTWVCQFYQANPMPPRRCGNQERFGPLSLSRARSQAIIIIPLVWRHLAWNLMNSQRNLRLSDALLRSQKPTGLGGIIIDG